ncbi:hypothetical protein ON010_g2198 [Phytophthora cinnamomi]|nr:hypothetical protein ON010_g2198 [Phytophthora cinnamomi]
MSARSCRPGASRGGRAVPHSAFGQNSWAHASLGMTADPRAMCRQRSLAMHGATVSCSLPLSARETGEADWLQADALQVQARRPAVHRKQLGPGPGATSGGAKSAPMHADLNPGFLALTGVSSTKADSLCRIGVDRRRAAAEPSRRALKSSSRSRGLETTTAKGKRSHGQTGTMRFRPSRRPQQADLHHFNLIKLVNRGRNEAKYLYMYCDLAGLDESTISRGITTTD